MVVSVNNPEASEEVLKWTEAEIPATKATRWPITKRVTPQENNKEFRVRIQGSALKALKKKEMRLAVGGGLQRISFKEIK